MNSKLKTILNKIKSSVKWVAMGIVAGIVALASIKRHKANKQVIVNNEAINDLQKCKDTIDMYLESKTDAINDAKEHVEYANQVTQEAESIINSATLQVEENQKILEKYKQ